MCRAAGGYAVQRLPGLEILPAMHATSQAHETGVPCAAHIEENNFEMDVGCRSIQQRRVLI